MGEFSITHLLLVAAIFLLFFGPSRLPQLGQSLGKAIRGFKQGLSEIEVEAKELKKDQLPHDEQNKSTVTKGATKKDPSKENSSDS